MSLGDPTSKMSKSDPDGCVYLMDYDAEQGNIIANLERTILQGSFVLLGAIILFSAFFATTSSRRMRKILTSMRMVREGEYSHKIQMRGSDEFATLATEFNKLTDRLQESEAQQRQFVSDASHELKTPLASIKLLSDSILQNEMDADTMREFVSDIGSEADRLTRMTQKLLTLNRAESAEPLKIDDSKFSPDQCVFDEDGIYWSFIRFEGDTAVIHGCGELYRFARPAIDDPDQTEWIAFEKY